MRRGAASAGLDRDDPHATVLIRGALAHVRRARADEHVRAGAAIVVTALWDDDDVAALSRVEVQARAHPAERALDRDDLAVGAAGSGVGVAGGGRELQVGAGPLGALRLLRRAREEPEREAGLVRGARRQRVDELHPAAVGRELPVREEDLTGERVPDGLLL